MAAKPEAKDHKEPAGAHDKAPVTPEVAPAGAPAKSSALMAWIPTVVAVVLAPTLSFLVAQFVLLPRMQAKLSAPIVDRAVTDASTAAPADDNSQKGAKDEKAGGGGGNYEFNNVVVNLAGTMGTRYLKTSFVVTAADKNTNIKAIFDAQKAKLTDITLNVLSSLTLADLEEPGSKNVLREKLVTAYNQALEKRVVDQVYFSDFVIQ